MDALQRTEYPAMLAHLQPAQAVQVLQERLRRIAKTNTDIADWLAERRRIEEQYAASLKRLAEFRVPANSAELGVFQPSWDSILRAATTVSDAHGNIGKNIGNNFEPELRAFQQGEETARMNKIASNLQGMAKELDDAQAQVDKLSKKGKVSASKIDAATQRLEDANQQWEVQAPYIFEMLQGLDESRTTNLRNLLTQLGTDEVEQSGKVHSIHENVLQRIVAVRTEDEVATFSGNVIRSHPRLTGRFASLQQPRQPSVAGSVAGSVAAGSTAAAQPPVPTQRASTDTGAGAASVTGAGEGATATESSGLGPAAALGAGGAAILGGAAALGQHAAPQTPPATAGGASAASAAASPMHPQLERSATSSTAATGSQSHTQSQPAPPSHSQSFSSQHQSQQEQQSGGSSNFKEKSQQAATPEKSKGFRSRFGTIISRRRQSINGLGQLTGIGKKSGNFNRISVSSHGPDSSPRSSYNNLADTNRAHGGRLDSLAESPDVPPPASRDGATNGVGGGAAPSGPSRTGTASSAVGGLGVVDSTALNNMNVNDVFGYAPPDGPPPSSAAGKEPARDAEGYSLPSAANDPISQAQRDAALASHGEQLGEGAGDDQLYRVNIQNNPVEEEDAQAKRAALSSVSSALSAGMPTRKTGTVRGRRDVRNTIYVPSPTSGESSSGMGIMPTAVSLPTVSRSSTFGSAFNANTATPTKPSAVAALAAEGLVGGASDTQSVRSSTSVSNKANLKHIDGTEPGLNASIIERVSATFENKKITSAKVNGRIALTYNAPSKSAAASPSSNKLKIRINNVAALESIGRNEDFVESTEEQGDYVLDSSHLHPKATECFTFRAHEENDTALASHVPLAFWPTWKPMDDHLRLILHYRLNPDSRLAETGQPVVLKNVYLIATYEGQCGSISSKPPATHIKDMHLVYWRIPELTLSPTATKILCMFRPDPSGAVPTAGHLEARWEHVVPVDVGPNQPGRITVSVQEPEVLAEEEEEQDPFADTSLPSPKTATNGAGGAGGSGFVWREIPVARQMASGDRYESR